MHRINRESAIKKFFFDVVAEKNVLAERGFLAKKDVLAERGFLAKKDVLAERGFLAKKDVFSSKDVLSGLQMEVFMFFESHT